MRLTVAAILRRVVGENYIEDVQMENLQDSLH